VCYLKAEPFQGWIPDDESNRFLWYIVSVCHILQMTLRLCSLSYDNLVLLMQQQFVINYIICQAEIPTLLDSWVKNVPSIKLFWPQKKCFAVYFCTNLTCLNVILLRICQVLDFRLSLCPECCMLSFGWFPNVWILYADVSEHSVCSIFIGRYVHLPAYEDGTDRVFWNVGI